VPNSFLIGKTFPPQPKGLTKQERQKDEEQSHQYDEDQDHEMIEEVEVAMKQAAEEVAQEPRYGKHGQGRG